jgi:hypothetical protein
MPERRSPAARLLLALLPLLGCGEPAVIPDELQLDSAAPGDGADGADGTDGAALDDWPCSEATPGNTHTLRVQNNAAGVIDVLWVDSGCVETRYVELQPGAAHDQLTGDGHVWLFRDGPTQEVLGWIQVNETFEEVTFP